MPKELIPGAPGISSYPNSEEGRSACLLFFQSSPDSMAESVIIAEKSYRWKKRKKYSANKAVRKKENNNRPIFLAIIIILEMIRNY